MKFFEYVYLQLRFDYECYIFKQSCFFNCGCVFYVLSKAAQEEGKKNLLPDNSLREGVF